MRDTSDIAHKVCDLSHNMMAFTIRPAIPIKCFKVDNLNEEHTFASLALAQKFLFQEHGKKVHHTTIKRTAEKNATYLGYKWSNVEVIKQEVNTDDVPEVFTFRECVEAIFNGNQIRITKEFPRRASVFDIMKIITKVKNPRDSYANLLKGYPDVVASFGTHLFPGSGEKATPVCDAKQLIELVNILSGKRAALFRKGASDILVRFLAGDQTLHNEVNENARYQTTLPQAHPMRTITETVESMNPLYKASQFISSNFKDKLISDYYKRPVVYMLRFTHDGNSYMKIGYSYNFAERIKDHITELSGCQLYAMYEVQNPIEVEREFKKRFASYQVPITINNQVKTEVFSGLTMEQWELQVERHCDEFRVQNELTREMVLKDKEYEHELATLRLKEKEMMLQSLNALMKLIADGKLDGNSRVVQDMLGKLL